MVTYKHDHTHITSPEPEKIIDFYTKVIGAKIVKEIEGAGRKLVDVYSVFGALPPHI